MKKKSNTAFIVLGVFAAIIAGGVIWLIMALEAEKQQTISDAPVRGIISLGDIQKKLTLTKVDSNKYREKMRKIESALDKEREKEVRAKRELQAQKSVVDSLKAELEKERNKKPKTVLKNRPKKKRKAPEIVVASEAAMEKVKTAVRQAEKKYKRSTGGILAGSKEATKGGEIEMVWIPVIPNRETIVSSGSEVIFENYEKINKGGFELPAGSAIYTKAQFTSKRCYFMVHQVEVRGRYYKASGELYNKLKMRGISIESERESQADGLAIDNIWKGAKDMAGSYDPTGLGRKILESETGSKDRRFTIEIGYDLELIANFKILGKK